MTEAEKVIEDTELLEIIAPYVANRIRLWQRGDLEDDQVMGLQAFMLEQGLAAKQPYVPEVHGPCPYGYTEPGDSWLVLTPIALYFLSRF